MSASPDRPSRVPPAERRGYEPVPGESRLFLVVSAVVLALGALGLLAAVVANVFVDGLGPTMVGCAVLAGLGLGMFVLAAVQRRRFLRARRYGDPLVREPWRGGSSTHSW